MVSDEELRKWMEERYPEYKDNLKLARILYEREMKKKKVSVETVKKEDKVVRIAELPKMVGKIVVVKGIVAERGTEVVQERCSICHRRGCEHDDAKKELVKFVDYLIGDETDVVRAVLMGKVEEFKELQLDDIVSLRGRVVDNGKELIIKVWHDGVEVVKTDKTKMLLEWLESLDEYMHEAIVRKRAKEFGVDFDRLVKDGKIEIVDGFVRVKRHG